MGKMLKYLKGSATTVLIIVLLLVVQAFADLSLPSYTSDIVNVGITLNGVDEKIPDAISATELKKVNLFLTEEDKNQFESYYDLKTKKEISDSEYKDLVSEYPAFESDDLYVLKEKLTSDEKEEAAKILSTPATILYMFSMDNDQIKQMKAGIIENLGPMVPEGTKVDDVDLAELLVSLPKETSSAVVNGMMSQFSSYMDSTDETEDSDQTSMNGYYIKTLYKDMGVDLSSIQANYLFLTGGKMLGFAALIMIISILVTMFAARVAAKMGRDLRGHVFRKVVSFSGAEFDQFSTASLITRSTNDIQQVQMFMVLLLRMVIYAPILGIGGIIKVANSTASMGWIIALAVILIVGLVLILMVIAMPKFNRMQKLVDRLNLVTREILTGLPVIRAFSTEKHEEERFEVANTDLTKNMLFTNRVMTFMMPIMMLILNGISCLIIWVGGHGIDDGVIQTGDMMAFMQYTMIIVMSFLMLTMVSIFLPRAAVAAKRIDEVLTSQNLIIDPTESKNGEASKKGVVEFNHVNFRYPNAEEDVLHDITFTALPGQTTAFIGSTGSGKSTLVNLIPRFYDVTSGSVTVDGVDVRDMKQHDLRDKLGFVPQKGVLFSGTIASNIAYGNREASIQQVKKAASIAQASDFIEAKEEQYESPIAQGGTNVSGGQKQRLAIARAIAKDPEIYVFDDSFSALDYKTDVTLRKALQEETKDSTVLIVAQRISTILHADKIIVLDEGKVSGIGTHKELLNSNEVYRQIAYSQLSQDEIEKDLEGEV